MAGKAVTSKDPRKPGIVSALKALSCGRKVTMVKEVRPGVFEGHVLGEKRTSGHGYCALGFYRVQEVKNELGVVTHYVEAGAAPAPAKSVLMQAAEAMDAIFVTVGD